MDDEVPNPTDPDEGDLSSAAADRPLDGIADQEAEELKRMIDAGASSPEELRALAERIRQHKEMEESRWREEVRPGLMEAKKRRAKLSDIRSGETEKPERDNRMIGLGIAIVVGVLILLAVASQSSFLLILLPVLAVLVYAYLQGRQPPTP